MILLCTFFFLVGMKRIAIPAVVLFVVHSFFLKNKKFLKPFLILQGLLWIAFFFLYVYGVRTGEVSKIMNMVGIDMMGRDYLWQLVGEHYDFPSAIWDTVLNMWIRSLQTGTAPV